MRSIDLTFDEALDSAVRSEWRALAEAGLPSLASHAGVSNRPHVTLAAGDALAVSGHPSFVPFAIALGPIVLFPRKSGFVVARSVVPSPELLDLHRRVHERLADAFEHTLLDQWTPHVTLSRRLTAVQLDRASTVLGEPASGTAAAMRLWDSGTATVTVLPAMASDASSPVENA